VRQASQLVGFLLRDTRVPPQDGPGPVPAGPGAAVVGQDGAGAGAAPASRVSATPVAAPGGDRGRPAEPGRPRLVRAGRTGPRPPPLRALRPGTRSPAGSSDGPGPQAGRRRAVPLPTLPVGRARRAPVRHAPLRHRSRPRRPRPGLPPVPAPQRVRRRWQLHAHVPRRRPGPDDHGQRPARRCRRGPRTLSTQGPPRDKEPRTIRLEEFRQARRVHGGLWNLAVALLGVKLARVPIPSKRLRLSLYRTLFGNKYPPGVKEHEAERPLWAYPSLNAFFTRGIKPEF